MTNRPTADERQAAITTLLSEHDFKTQDQIRKELRKQHFIVGSETVAKDLKALGAYKTSDEGIYRIGTAVYRKTGPVLTSELLTEAIDLRIKIDKLFEISCAKCKLMDEARGALPSIHGPGVWWEFGSLDDVKEELDTKKTIVETLVAAGGRRSKRLLPAEISKRDRLQNIVDKHEAYYSLHNEWILSANRWRAATTEYDALLNPPTDEVA